MSHIYTLNKIVNSNHIDLSGYIPLSDAEKYRLYDEYPKDVVDSILERDFLDVNVVNDLTIMNQHEDIVKPKWRDYDIV